MATPVPDPAVPLPEFRMPWSLLGGADHRGGWTVLRSLAMGLTITLVAISLRLVLGTEVGRDQIVFSYPAVIVATLLFGTPAGALAATVCVVVAWYYVVPPAHSFAMRDTAALTILLVDIFTSAVLVATIGALRSAIERYQRLAAELESQVRERTAERNRLWERSPELLAIARGGGRIRALNPALTRLLGTREGAHADLGGLMAEEDAIVLRDALRRLREGANSVAFEARVRAHDGEVWVAWNAVQDDEQVYLVGRDVTIERECGEQLRHSQKLEAVGLMTGGLAHDFGNLLTPVGMSLDLIRRRHGDEPRTRELLDRAEEATDRARELVRRLLDFARRTGRKPVRIDVARHIEQLRLLLEQSAGDRPVQIDVDTGLAPIVADPNALDSALLNLVVNARDASPPAAPIMISAVATGPGGVRLRVADRGSGMDRATLARVREPFFSTKPRGRGTGLGLAMVQALMEMVNGRLHIESAPGEGTAVDLEFPPAIASA